MPNARDNRNVLRGCLLVLFAVGLAAIGLPVGCDLLNPSRLVIKNVGNAPIENVVVSAGEGQQWALGDLPVGQTMHFSRSLKGEGGLDVSFSFGAERVVWNGCYYTSGGLMPAEGKLAINGRETSGSCGD